MRTRTKRTLAIIVVLGVAVAALIVARSYIFDRLKNTLHEKIRSLNKTDLNIRYDSVYVDWRRNVIRIDKLVIEKDAYDTTCAYPEFISAEKVQVEGFSLLAFVFYKRLSFKIVELSNLRVVIRQNSQLLRDSASQQENDFRLSIGDLLLSSAHLEYTDSATCKPVADLKTTIRASSLAVDAYAGKPLKVSLRGIRLDGTTIDLPEEFYTLKVKTTAADLKKGTLQLDTLKIIPHYAKVAFGRKKGYETDRVEGVVPFISLSGLTLRYPDTFAISAKSASIQMFLKLFRDKRLPDKKRSTLLPVQQLRKLPFGLNIDTLRVIKSYVEYEEFQMEPELPIRVYFDNLSAHILHINNDKGLTDGETIVKARADFMGTGDLEMVTLLPWQTEKNCRMQGALKNFDLARINPILEPAANMKIESGTMKKLAFNYAYNPTRSDGVVDLNYHDLKLISFKNEERLKKDKQRSRNKNKDPDELRKDNLKSFIINAFVIRRNMDESVPEEKRTGTVLFYRDPSKSFFNYWWKSLFSGVKSAYNLDKLEGLKKNNKRDKKKDK